MEGSSEVAMEWGRKLNSEIANAHRLNAVVRLYCALAPASLAINQFRLFSVTGE
jgi:hypothetical protein